jgi:hypothetical protein
VTVIKRFCCVMGVIWLIGTASIARAAALDPNDFLSWGAFPGGNFTIDTDTMTVDGLSGGVIRAQTAGAPDIAVFTFDAANITPDQVIDVVGSRPAAILFQDSTTIQGRFNVTAGGGLGGIPRVDLGNGENWGLGPGFGKYAHGAGHGGAGGVPGKAYASTGGAVYGDLRQAVQGGSGGGATTVGYLGDGSGGGEGGGGIEIGAVGTLTLNGAVIYARGGNGKVEYHKPVNGGGGGSGGGIFIHAFNVRLELATLNVRGGDGRKGYGSADYVLGGGGGGGGRITVLTNTAGFRSSQNNQIDYDGGLGGRPVSSYILGHIGKPGERGVVDIDAKSPVVGLPVPEPASSALLLIVGINLFKSRRF